MKLPLSPILFTTGTKAGRSSALWGGLFATTLATSAIGYASTYPTGADRLKLSAAFSSNPGIAAIFGSARRLDTVAGFTAWRCLAVLGIVGAVWGMLLATRLCRGEEESGRLEVLLAGGTTRRKACADELLGLLAGLVVTLVIVTATAVVVGRARTVDFSIPSCLYLGVCLVATPAIMMSVGTLASQILATRRQANQWAGGFFGLFFVIRMVADSTKGLAWLRWLSPLGWVEGLHPMTGSRWSAGIPIVVLLGLCGGSSIFFAGRRDLGAGVAATKDRANPRYFLLRGVGGLVIRLEIPILTGWLIALSLLGLLFGLVAQSAANAVSASTSIQKALARLGGHRSGAAAYLGLVFVVVAALLAVVAAGQISSMRNEESSGYLDNLLVRQVDRRRWMAGRLVTALGLVTAGGAVAGAMSWAGAASQDSGIGFETLVSAGLNDVAPAVFCLGVGALVYATAPRMASGLAYGVVVWSFLVQLVGSIVRANRWLLDTSILHHISPAPAGPVDWAGVVWLAGLGVAASLIGLMAFAGRDLASA